MADYILSERAKKDLIGIGAYTRERWSEVLAEQYVRMLLAECRGLARKPLIGRSYEIYRPGMLGFQCGKHVIFYRILRKIKFVSFVFCTRRWTSQGIYDIVLWTDQ